jgi:hypothetical protein
MESADCYHYSPTSCKWFYGEGYLTELAIQNVDSSVTGKTSYRGQDTELSTFLIEDFFSACFFRGQKLERLDISNYEFVETAGFVHVSPKSVSLDASN